MCENSKISGIDDRNGSRRHRFKSDQISKISRFSKVSLSRIPKISKISERVEILDKIDIPEEIYILENFDNPIATFEKV